jgi:hypothetical protein
MGEFCGALAQAQERSEIARSVSAAMRRRCMTVPLRARGRCSQLGTLRSECDVPHEAPGDHS